MKKPKLYHELNEENKGFGSLDLAQRSLEQAPDTAGAKTCYFQSNVSHKTILQLKLYSKGSYFH